MFVFGSLSDRNTYCQVFVISELQNDLNLISYVEFLFETDEHHVIPVWNKYKFCVCVYRDYLYNLRAVLKLHDLRRIRRCTSQLIGF